MSEDPDFEMEVVGGREADLLDEGEVDSSETKLSSDRVSQTDKKQPMRAPVEDWERVKLHEVAVRRSENVDPEEAELDRHVGLEHITPDNPVPDFESLDGQSSTKRHFLPGDVLYAKLRPYLRKAAHPDFEGLCTSEIIPIVAGGAINAKFLLYRLSSKRAFDYAIRTSIGTRMPRTSWNLFQNLEFELPPLPEQRKIASVLYTVDQAIQKTEEIIEQAKRVKRGLMQKVLSHGIDSEGNVRNPEREPQDFQELDLGGFEERLIEDGQIPKSWEYVPLENCLSDFVSGAAISSGEFSKSGFPVVAKGDVTDDEVIELSSERQYVAKEVAEKYSSSVIDSKYMVVSLRDLVPSAPTVGSASFVDAKSKFLLAQGAYGLLTDEEKLDQKFFVSLTRSGYFRSYMRRTAVGSTQVHVRSSEYKKMHIPLPPLEEQKKISSHLASVDEEKRSARRQSELLKHLKKGLMQDLLTGEVRTADKAIHVLVEVVEHG